MSNWGENPEHYRRDLEQHALPDLLGEQCFKNCLNDLAKATHTEGERLCIANCQKKTSRAFDMYMGL